MASEPSTMELPLLGPQDPRPTTPTLSPPPATRLKPIRRYQHWWAELGRDTWTDIRHVRSGDGILWVPLYFILAIILQVVALASMEESTVWTSASSLQDIPSCLPDGSFGDLIDYNRWGLPGFFQITVRSGPITFTQAKVIDITWDILIGRVGQSVMAYYSWKAFSTYTRLSMEIGPVTFDTFFATHLEEAASLKSTVKMIRDFTTRQALRSRSAMAFIIGSMLFILAWPTLAGAMTGYTAAETAFVSNSEGGLVPINKIISVPYVIHDGWRIGLKGDYLVTQGIMSVSDEACIRAYSTGPCGNHLTADVDSYVKKYGLLPGLVAEKGVSIDKTEWKEELLGPALNISAFYVPNIYNDVPNIYNDVPEFDDDDLREMDKLLNRARRVFTTVDYNKTYSVEFLLKNGTCQTREVTDYQWGFSFLQLFIDSLFLVSWAIGTWVLWLKAHLELGRQNIEVSNKYRAMLDLAAALDREMTTIGENIGAISNKKLAGCVKTQLRGGTIEAAPSVPPPRYDYSTWIRERRGWVIAYLLTATWVVPWILANLLVVGTSVSVALCVGRTRKTRMFICLCVFVTTSLSLLPLFFAEYGWHYLRLGNRLF